MKLSKASAHAALSLAYLASRRGDGPVQARQVGDHLGIPTDSALKILQALARAELVRSRLGRAGGYRLDLAPEEVTLLQIVEAMDGPIAAEVPLGSGVGSGVGALEEACRRAASTLRDELGRFTLAALVRQRETELAS